MIRFRTLLVNLFYALLGLAALILYFWGAVAFSQVRTIEPAYVVVTAPKDPINIEAVKAVKGQLRDMRTVVLAMRSADFEIQLNALQISGGNCQGYAAAVLVTNRNTGMGVLRGYTSATIEGLARQVAKDASRDFEQGKNAWR